MASGVGRETPVPISERTEQNRGSGLATRTRHNNFRIKFPQATTRAAHGHGAAACMDASAGACALDPHRPSAAGPPGGQSTVASLTRQPSCSRPARIPPRGAWLEGSEAVWASRHFPVMSHLAPPHGDAAYVEECHAPHIDAGSHQGAGLSHACLEVILRAFLADHALLVGRRTSCR